MYFGFTHCPDICPDELDKMAKMIDTVKAKRGNVLTPIFVTADPNRDSPEIIKEYLADFHPDIKGLTGPYDDIKAMCKAYRVYFSTPPHVKPGQDYLVDHSIYFYLMGQSNTNMWSQDDTRTRANISSRSRRRLYRSHWTRAHGAERGQGH